MEKILDHLDGMNNSVPYIVYESAQAKSERTVKRLVIALIVAVALIFASNMAWLYVWSSYDYSGTETTTTYTQDGEGTNIIGDSNEVTDESANGESSQDTETNFEEQK